MRFIVPEPDGKVFEIGQRDEASVSTVGTALVFAEGKRK